MSEANPTLAATLKILENACLKVVLEPFSSDTCLTIYPAYRGNYGFFYLSFSGGGEALLLKGVFADFVRVLPGTKLPEIVTEEKLLSLSRTLAEAEKILRAPFEFEAALRDDGEFYIFSAREHKGETSNAVDPLIPRPLTGAEYGAASVADAGLYSRSFLDPIFGETVSVFTKILTESLSDIFSLLFQNFDVRVGSPTLKCVHRRLYLNVSALAAGCREIGGDINAFAKRYMPYLDEELFRERPRLLHGRVKTGELESLAEEAEKLLSVLGAHSFFQSDFWDPLKLMGVWGIALPLLFEERLERLKKLSARSEEEVLGMVYASRGSSFFIKGLSIEAPHNFDPSSPAVNVEIPADSALYVPAAPLWEKLPAPFRLFRRKRIEGALAELHRLLDLRDRLYLLAVKYHALVRGCLSSHADYFTAQKRFAFCEDIFLASTEEIRRLQYNITGVNLEPVIEYRRGYRDRSAAQHVPSEVYGADMKYVGLISERQTEKLGEKWLTPCKSYNHAEKEAGVNYRLKKNFSLPLISAMGLPERVLTESAPPLAFISEYCFLRKIPLYYAVRDIELLFKGKVLRECSKDALKLAAGGR